MAALLITGSRNRSLILTSEYLLGVLAGGDVAKGTTGEWKAESKCECVASKVAANFVSSGRM